MIERDLYGQVLERVHAFMPSMLPGHRYTLETICGNAFWDPLNRYQRGSVGRFIAWAVVEGDLPLIFADTGKRRTKMYQLL